MDAILPGWRGCMEPYMHVLAPDALHAASLSREAAKAMEQAEFVTTQVCSPPDRCVCVRVKTQRM